MKNDIGLSRTVQTPTIKIRPSTIWIGDNLNVMRAMPSEVMDLIYLDPPFNSGALYEGTLKAEGSSFDDTWTMEKIDKAEFAGWAIKEPELHSLVSYAGKAYGKSMKAYLIFMVLRLKEIHRILKDTGTVYLHIDTTASHYLKLAMDTIFGKNNFRNEVVWRYGKMQNASKNFPKCHDVILRYTKTDNYTFNVQKGADSEYKERFKRFLTGNKILYGSVKHLTDKLIIGRIKKVCKENNVSSLKDSDVLFDFDKEFKAMNDVIYVPIVKGNSKEKTGWKTQKPLQLLKHIISASSNVGDLVFDPFCGCATTLVAADDLNRKWIGCDESPDAAVLLKDRIEKNNPEDHGADSYLFEIEAAPERICIKNAEDENIVPVPVEKPKRRSTGYKKHKRDLFGKQEGVCNGCKDTPKYKYFVVDHIKPVCEGGTDDIDNLQVLCYHCNSLKGKGTMEDLKRKLKEDEEE